MTMKYQYISKYNVTFKFQTEVSQTRRRQKVKNNSGVSAFRALQEFNIALHFEHRPKRNEIMGLWYL